MNADDHDGDPTEAIRGAQQALCNALPDALIPTERWDADALARDFDVLGFLAPYVIVRRRSDDAVGSLLFRHAPRVYFCWHPYDDGVPAEESAA